MKRRIELSSPSVFMLSIVSAAAPSPGRITDFYAPGGPGIRVDTHVYAGYMIPPYYDSMIAKLLAHGNTREEAIARKSRALEEFVIVGVATTNPFHVEMMKDPDFVLGNFDTGTLERKRKARETSPGGAPDGS